MGEVLAREGSGGDREEMLPPGDPAAKTLTIAVVYAFLYCPADANVSGPH